MYLDPIPQPLSVQDTPLDPLALGQTLCQVLQSVAPTHCAQTKVRHTVLQSPNLRTPPSKPPSTRT
jgi:hypothetical protein